MKKFFNPFIFTLVLVLTSVSFSSAVNAEETNIKDESQNHEGQDYKEKVKEQVNAYEKYVQKVRDFEGSDEFNNSLLKEKIQHEIIVGDDEAPVTIVEYASLTCNHCKRFHEDVYYDVKKKYIDEGKVRFKYRHYPLNGPAVKAAAIVSCVGELNRPAFLGALFKGQSQWAFSKSESALMDKLKTISKIGGMRTDDFFECYDNEDIQDEILTHMKKANEQLGVDSTPTIFIDGVRFLGARTFDAVSRAIEERLDIHKKLKDKKSQSKETTKEVSNETTKEASDDAELEKQDSKDEKASSSDEISEDKTSEDISPEDNGGDKESSVKTGENNESDSEAQDSY